MFIALGIVLLTAWLLGFLVFHVASVGIHILVLAAVTSVVLHFVFGARKTT